MDNTVTEPGFLKLSSSILTINHPIQAKVPKFTIISSEMQEEHLLVPVLGSGTHLPISLTPVNFSAFISIASSPSDHIPSF